MSLFDTNIIQEAPLTTIFKDWDVHVQIGPSYGGLQINLDKYDWVRNYLEDVKRRGLDIFGKIVVGTFNKKRLNDRGGWGYSDIPKDNYDIYGMSVVYLFQDIDYMTFSNWCMGGKHKVDWWRFICSDDVKKFRTKVMRRTREWFRIPKPLHIRVNINTLQYYEFIKSYVFRIAISIYTNNPKSGDLVFDIQGMKSA